MLDFKGIEYLLSEDYSLNNPMPTQWMSVEDYLQQLNDYLLERANDPNLKFNDEPVRIENARL